MAPRTDPNVNIFERIIMNQSSSLLMLFFAAVFFLTASLLSQDSLAGCCMKKNPVRCENTDSSDDCELFYDNKVCKKGRYCSANTLSVEKYPRLIPEDRLDEPLLLVPNSGTTLPTKQ